MYAKLITACVPVSNTHGCARTLLDFISAQLAACLLNYSQHNELQKDNKTHDTPSPLSQSRCMFPRLAILILNRNVNRNCEFTPNFKTLRLFSRVQPVPKKTNSHFHVRCLLELVFLDSEMQNCVSLRLFKSTSISNSQKRFTFVF